MLQGKKLLITGVINRESIAFEVARQAQEHGAEVVLTGFGRAKRMTERAAQRLPQPPDVLELDVNSPADLEAVAEDLRGRWGPVDGVLRAISGEILHVDGGFHAIGAVPAPERAEAEAPA